ncbi:MAG TPA: ATP-binding cassette domain-containing protein, partial [Devosia sp.]|nr:ATP-binding cassette domain-containing protein [Devosia sp.]
MAAAPLLTLQNIHLTFGGTTLLNGAELAVSAGQRIALVGRNGSGKSTLLKIASGDVAHDSGVRFVEPRATLRYLPQEPDLSAYSTTLEYVEEGLGPGDDDYRAQYLLNSLGLTGAENPRNLSGGEGRRAALARVLAPKPDILLLDEPTNHLDLAVIEWLQEELNSLRSAMILISHDRRFLSDLTRSTVWLDRGVTRRLDKGFGAFEEWRD